MQVLKFQRLMLIDVEIQITNNSLKIKILKKYFAFMFILGQSEQYSVNHEKKSIRKKCLLFSICVCKHY